MTTRIEALIEEMRVPEIAMETVCEAVSDLSGPPTEYIHVALHCANVLLETPSAAESLLLLRAWILSGKHEAQSRIRMCIMVTALTSLQKHTKSPGKINAICQPIDTELMQHHGYQPLPSSYEFEDHVLPLMVREILYSNSLDVLGA